MYCKEIPKHSALTPFVKGFFSYKCKAGKTPVLRRFVPAGAGGWIMHFDIDFHPAGLFHLTRQSAENFTDRIIFPETLLGEEAEKLYTTLTAQPSSPARFSLAEKFPVKFFEGREVEKEAINSVLSFIDRSHPLPQVKEICREFGIHRDTLRQMFLEKVGITPKRYLGLKRFMRAVGLAFLHPRWDLQDICLQAGFYDSPHFNREFKRYAGISPGKFLRQYRGQELPVSIFF